MRVVDERHVIGRRNLLRATAVAPLSLTVASAAPASPGPAANVLAFGAKGDGRSDDLAAFRSALDKSRKVEVPPGRYRLSSPIVLRDGQILRGSGRSGWEPYKGSGPPQSAVRTELITDGLAVDARNTNNAAVAGIAIRAAKGRQSDWGAPAGHQPGTIGLDISGSNHFDAENVSFHGLETGFYATGSSARPTKMPRLGDWVAEDCDVAVRLHTAEAENYGVTDARIEGCLAALHCNKMVEARRCDGLRIENSRFFQCLAHSVDISDTAFLSIVGTTIFESGLDGLVLKRCQYTSLAGVLIARSGYFRKGRLLQRSAAVFDKCLNLSFEGVIEQPIGRGVFCRNSRGVALTGTIGGPFWSTGYPGADDGALRVEESRSVMVNLAFTGETYWVAVWADARSSQTMSGKISTELSAGVVRCIHLQQEPWGTTFRTDRDHRLGRGERHALGVARVLVPGGKALFLCSAQATTDLFGLAAGSAALPMQPGEPGGGTITTERKLLASNPAKSDRYLIVPFALINAGSTSQTVPAGTEIQVSLAIG